ncbi:unnamed protein product [Didymodactylos carnosus]|uniref:Reverse transcriptase RNase H-like domain-containing protein n=1 Tax=Didymodactylos carnosus TaxID=1234261 RepID=A0A8S2X7C5_9BILA|nr:unnamed protein product [Didymodactylos carnosus]
MFGSRSSPAIFDELSFMICWIARNNYGIRHILHLLDDFLAIHKPDSADPNMVLLKLLFNRLNVPLSKAKCLGPNTELEYLGILLNTVIMQAKLPEYKRLRVIETVEKFATKRKCTKRELLSLIGHLSYACKVVVPGRSFYSYLLKLAYSVPELHHHLYLTADSRIDLHMWKTFLKAWNGTSIFLDSAKTLLDSIHTYTDAAGSLGLGGYYDRSWFAHPWPDYVFHLSANARRNMALLELFPIVVASVLWGARWSHKQMIFHCDNEATVAILRKGRFPDPVIMRLVRQLTLCSIKHNFTFYAEHIPGKANVVGDLLSRLQIHRFKMLVPDAEPECTPLPPMSHLFYP